MSGNSTASPTVDADGSGASAATVVEGIAIGLAVICVALRFYTRIFTKAGLRWDDWFIFAALISTLAAAALLLAGEAIDPNGAWVSDNTDNDRSYSSADQLYLKLLLLVSLLYFTISGTTKLGILLLYHRLFSIRRGSFHYQIVILGVLVVCYWIGCTVAVLTNCVPLERSWIDNLTDPRYCFNFNVFWAASGAVEVLLDVVILASPIQVVVSLNLSTRKKLTVVGIFLLGAFVVVTGLLKTVLGYQPGGRNPSYSKTEVWTSIHTGMAIVCACLPTLGPLVLRLARSKAAVRVANSAMITRLGSLSPRRRRSPAPIFDILESGDIGRRSDSMSGTEKEKAPDVGIVFLPHITQSGSFVLSASDLARVDRAFRSG